ncbi:MAG: M23 family metallopeptidase [Sandaracinaceae bacterium]|nr:M23 family metallopeptidase [Sandaracinaceae bacterium]
MGRIRAVCVCVMVALWLPGAPALGEPSDQHARDHDAADPVARRAVRTRPNDRPVVPLAVSPLPDGFVPGSTYGVRVSPRTGRRTFHAGADFLAPRGTPVHAVRAGIVERVTRNTLGRTRFGGYGRAVVVYHPDVERWSFYAHLDSVDVTEGQELRAGDPIGAVGNSCNRRFRGMATHLHFEVRGASYGGRSPFPGPYRRHNQDPIEWLESMGVRFVRATPAVHPS